MASKAWGFLLKVFVVNSVTKETMEAGQFEAEGISPYKIVAGAKSDVMGSENYDHVINAMAMGDFISNIGDKNTLSVKKLRDPMTDIFSQSKRENKTISAINLYVTSLSAIAAKLKGEPRLQALYKNSLEMVTLEKVMVTSIWTVYYAKGNSPIITYDYVTFETKEKTQFYFKGKDWK